jgi:aryl-phospho-beta-D-glucosidase BglC (GH1 family)
MALHFKILFLAIFMIFMVETPFSQNNTQLLAQLEDNNNSPKFIGVAMRGNSTSAKEHEENDIPFPENYYEESFKLIHDAGMNHIRYLFYWESYAKNPSLFLEELEIVAQTADRWGIKVLYDNHQWHTSSWLESKGTGFPSFLFIGNA